MLAATDHKLFNHDDPRRAALLLDYLSKSLEEEVLAFGEPQSIPLGIENRNFHLTAHLEGRSIPLILRCRPETIPEWRTSDQLYDLKREFRVLQELTFFDIPTPRAFGYDGGAVFGAPCFLMEYLPGKPMPWPPDGGPADRLIARYAAAIAAISQIDFAANPRLADLLPVWTIERTLDWHDWRAEPHRGDPLVSYALAWLQERKPPSGLLVLCHGDVNPGNILEQNQQITGIVDWEFACLKDDPLGELACVPYLAERPDLAEIFCQSFGRAPGELEWFFARAQFGACFSGEPDIPTPQAARERLAKSVGYSE